MLYKTQRTQELWLKDRAQDQAEVLEGPPCTRPWLLSTSTCKVLTMTVQCFENAIKRHLCLFFTSGNGFCKENRVQRGLPKHRAACIASFAEMRSKDAQLLSASRKFGEFLVSPRVLLLRIKRTKPNTFIKKSIFWTFKTDAKQSFLSTDSCWTELSDVFWDGTCKD